jgi:hypothetical protein
MTTLKQKLTVYFIFISKLSAFDGSTIYISVVEQMENTSIDNRSPVSS